MTKELPQSTNSLENNFEKMRQKFYLSQPNEKIDLLLDALQFGRSGISFVAEGLKDHNREVRQANFLLLSENKESTAEYAVYNHLPFAKMECLHTIVDFGFDTKCHPDALEISSYHDTAIAYWDLTYRSSELQSWDLATGKLKLNTSLGAHEFSIANDGKYCLTNYQYFVFVLDSSIHQNCLKDDYFFSNNTGDAQCVVASPYKQNLVVFCSSWGYRSTFEVWNYLTPTCLFHQKISGKALAKLNLNWYRLELSKIDRYYNHYPPLIFFPDDRLLLITFIVPGSQILELWDVESQSIVKTWNSNIYIAITGTAISKDGKIIVCGRRGLETCIWDLETTSVIYSIPQLVPCIMTPDARTFVYCNYEYDIIIWDVVGEEKLCTLKGHKAPIIYLKISSDREYIVSYSCDGNMKIWGIPDPS